MAKRMANVDNEKRNRDHTHQYNHISSMQLLAVLLCFTAQAATVLLILEQFPDIKRNSFALVCIGIGSLLFFMFLARKLFQRVLGTDRAATIPVSAFFFTVTCWSACIDLIFTLSLLGITKLGRFYMYHGEEYFRTAYGVACLGYDGTIHLLLQLYLAHTTLLGRHDIKQLFVGLLWAGSIINSMTPLLMGAATGAFSGNIKPSTALNAPYVLVPIAYAVSMFTKNENNNVKKQVGAKCMSFFDLVRILGHICSILFHIIRCMVVLGSQASVAHWWSVNFEPILDVSNKSSDKGYPDYGVVTVQILQNFFYMIPYHGACVAVIVLKKRLPNLSKLSVLMAGAHLNAQVVYVTIGSFRFIEFGDLQNLHPPSLFYVVNLGSLCFVLIDSIMCWTQTWECVNNSIHKDNKKQSE